MISDDPKDNRGETASATRRYKMDLFLSPDYGSRIMKAKIEGEVIPSEMRVLGEYLSIV